jgi:diguanylate cyclase (GGDEF)-like protein
MMSKYTFLLFFIFLSATSVFAHDLKDEPGQVIRVGVFPNPPVAFKDAKGEWRGISIDVLQAIANQKGWKLEYVEGSFSKHLKNFEEDKIDIISMMAYSDKRAEKYTFSRNPIISNWGLIYSRPGSKISSLLDLEGKRVGVMKNNIHDTAFRKLAKKFNLKLKVVGLANFRDVMENVQTGKIDAGVVNRLFGALNANKYNLTETGVIFNPINIHYSSLKSEHKTILNVIDEKLLAFKADKDSVYFSAIRRWMTQPAHTQSYRWLIWLAVALFSVILVMFGLTILLRRQVAVRTQELQSEVDERRIAESKLDELAYYDSLTKLPNRVSLLEQLKISIAQAKRRNNKTAVLFIDIDRFKTVNDSLGHDAGDQLIIHVAKCLQACLRDEDSIHRFGGDEFVAILQDFTTPAYISHVTKRMLKSLDTPIYIDATEVFSSICIGIAMYPDDDDNGDNLLKYADAAMYHAKDQGGNNYQFYNKELTKRVQHRLRMEAHLRHALERNEFKLHYQPILNLKNLRPVGVEALIRWQDPQRALIMPDDFIPLAEETGLIVSIGDWVLEHACMQIKEWESQGLGQLHIAVNISSIQFDHNKLYSSVTSALNKAGLAAEQLELEITERMFLNITDNVRDTLDKLTNDGVKLSIDDFGTGYSSLSYLKQLPIDTLKVDRSFIMGIPEDKDDTQIAATVVTMAHGLGMDVVAEGIETEEQLKYLNTLGCGRGQGYYLSKPQSAEVITAFLKEKLDVK